MDDESRARIGWHLRGLVGSVVFLAALFGGGISRATWTACLVLGVVTGGALGAGYLPRAPDALKSNRVFVGIVAAAFVLGAIFAWMIRQW